MVKLEWSKPSWSSLIFFTARYSNVFGVAQAKNKNDKSKPNIQNFIVYNLSAK
jgi:hypothetical protein